jgi:GntR family transcriptional regulator
VDGLEIQLSDASGVPRYRQIVDQAALLVRSGQLAAGARLPSVRELAGQLLVSLITIRRAYADLEAAGLIVRRQGQGTFVAELDETSSRSHARDDARTLLADAVSRARQLGLDDDDIRGHVERVLRETGGNDAGQ